MTATGKKLKTVFLGTPAFALPSAQAAFDHTDLRAVITQPDRPRGRGQKMLPCEVKAWAAERHLPSFSPASLRKDSAELTELKEKLTQIEADLFIVTAYGNLLPQTFLDMPRLGSINVHASLLPRWRGASPIQRAIEAADPTTGVCLQKMVMELDAGDILAESQRAIGANDSSGELFVSLAADGGELLAHYLERLGEGSLTGQVQNPANITLAKKISKEEGLWTPEWTAHETHNRVRAFNPWPTVRAKLVGGPEFKILKSSLLGLSQTLPPAGSCEWSGSKVILGCQVRPGEPNQILALESIQVAGKSAVNAADFFRNIFTQRDSKSLKITKAEI